MGEQIPAEGFVIDIEGSGEIRSVFGTKNNGHLGSPHGLAIDGNGSSIYVAEIAPYRVVRLVPGKGVNDCNRKLHDVNLFYKRTRFERPIRCPFRNLGHEAYD